MIAYVATAALVIVPAFHYERWGPSEWGPILEYPFRVHNQNADVLIFGDSSAFIGIDPRILDKQLNIRSIVLPNTAGSLPVTGDIALDRYLSHNRAPRLLVLYFSPWDLDYGHSRNDHFLFEGEEMLLHNGSMRQIFAFALKEPADLLAFPLRLNSTLGLHSVAAAIRDRNREQATSYASGHADYTAAAPALAAPCLIPKELVSEDHSASVRALIRRYTTPQTRVVVYLAPVPSCVNVAAVVDRNFEPLAAAPPSTLPAADFAGDGSYAHLRPRFVAVASSLLAQALGLYLPKDSSAAPVRALQK